MPVLKIAHVSSEVAPWSQTGGLADVAGSLPRALATVEPDLEVAVFSPLHRGVAEKIAFLGGTLRGTDVEVTVTLGRATLHGRFAVGHAEGAPPVYLLDCPQLYDRYGLYADRAGVDYSDNALRFGFLAQAVLEAAPALMGGPPDVFHAHDWQAGLVPLLLSSGRYPSLAGARSVFTIHNLAYQGLFPADVLTQLDLAPDLFTPEGIEFHGQVSFMKAGLGYASAVTTVSPSYAEEILGPEAGRGLDGYLRHRVHKLVGIVNGIDTQAWNPATDAALAAHYDVESLAGKAACRAALCEEMGISPADDEPVCAVISRFTEQKGLDLVADLVPELHRLGARLIVLGTGDLELERRFTWLGERFRDHLAVRLGFDVGLARRIYAGADIMLMPSRFEPCGLNQLYAMRYGTVPVVSAVGGLRDTVIDADADPAHGTGYAFEAPSSMGLLWSLTRARQTFAGQPERWRTIVRRGMMRNSSWQRSAREYAGLYRTLSAE